MTLWPSERRRRSRRSADLVVFVKTMEDLELLDSVERRAWRKVSRWVRGT